jgi:hypothetical protein
MAEYLWPLLCASSEFRLLISSNQESAKHFSNEFGYPLSVILNVPEGHTLRRLP